MGSTSLSFTVCTGKEEVFWYNLTDFYTILPPHGKESRGYLYHPTRLLANMIGVGFLVMVPILYAIIYRFRKNNANNQQGLSEAERTRRIFSNKLTTKINFMAWLLEALGTLVFIIPIPVDPKIQFILFRVAIVTLAPLLYILAAERENCRNDKVRRLLGLPSNSINSIVE